MTMLKSLIHATLALTTVRAAPPGAGSAAGANGIITAEEALQAEQARYDALVGRDFGALERLYADDLVYIHSSSVQDTRQTVIEAIRSGEVWYHSMQRGDVKVRTFGSIAIISGRTNVEVRAQGQEMSLQLLFHSVWAKRAGGIQFVSWQATRVPPQQ